MDVEVETVARLCSRNGEARDSLPVKLTMRYTAADPYACAFTFEGAKDVSWTFARDVLADGLDRCSDHAAGDMDVMVYRGVAPGLVWLRLQSHDGAALFALTRADVARFVRRSYRLVARGAESEHLDLDACVAALLAPKS